MFNQNNTYNLLIFRMMKKMMTTRRMTVKRVNMLKIQSLKRTQIRFLMWFNRKKTEQQKSAFILTFSWKIGRGPWHQWYITTCHSQHWTSHNRGCLLLTETSCIYIFMYLDLGNCYCSFCDSLRLICIIFVHIKCLIKFLPLTISSEDDPRARSWALTGTACH